MLNSQKSTDKSIPTVTNSMNTARSSAKVEAASPLPNSARPMSGLTQTPSKILKEISSRKADLPQKLIVDASGIGEFLMLDVAASSKKVNATSASTQLESPKVESTPRSSTHCRIFFDFEQKNLKTFNSFFVSTFSA